jgi:hypothetical protein
VLRWRIGADHNSPGLLKIRYTNDMTHLTLRIDFDDGHAIRLGKVRLLEEVETKGSIRAVATEKKMSYRSAWLLLKAMETHSGRLFSRLPQVAKVAAGPA